MTTRVSSVVSTSTAASTPVSQAKSEARGSEYSSRQPVEDDDDFSTSGSHGAVTDEIVMDALWGLNTGVPTASLDYVRTHATAMLTRVLKEDPHTAYIALRSKLTDVRLFKVATLVAETPLQHERCDFRGVTRVPGSIDTVMEMLASEDERESYWVALNTQKGLLVNSLFATRRLDGAAPFPRWNQRYTATKFSKHTPPVECCFNEYAAFLATDDDNASSTETTPETEPLASLAGKRARLASQDTMASDGSPLRRAFVYRRSMDHRLFDMEDVQTKLSKYGETCERLYLQDYLLEVSETSEKHICKVVLTCSVYTTDNARAQQSSGSNQNDEKHSKSMRHEFRESCASMLQNLRQVLSNQWRDHMASSGVVAPSSVSMFSRSLGRRGGAQPAYCGVCSSGFSLLKKRNVCHACSLVVCSRCCTKQEKASQRSASAHDLNSRRATKECILCSQFGSDSASARVSVSLRRHFTSSTFNSQRSITAPSSEHDGEADALSETLSESGRDEEEEEEDVKVIDSVDELDDEEDNQQAAGESSSTQNGIPIKRNLRVRASTEDNTIASGWRESESDLPPRVTPRRRFKQRCESATLSSSAPRTQGIVLLTDIDTLSLTGSFHRLSTTSGGTGRGRLDSGTSDTGSALSSSFVRASPPMPPSRVHRPVRSVSEDVTLLLPTDFKLDTSSRRSSIVADETIDNNNSNTNNTEESHDELDDELDDLANFNLKLL